MILEHEPLYFKAFREYVEKKFEEQAISTAQGFHEVHERMDKVEENVKETRVYIEKIEGHIGRYEIRSTRIEDTFLKNYDRRIKSLEEAYLAS